MKQELIRSIEQSMLRYLDNAQLDMLDKTLNRCFEEVSITKKDEKSSGLIFEHTNEQFVDLFISAKTIEGCSLKTMNLYRQELNKCIIDSKLNATQMTTIYLRDYLSKYYENGKCSKSTIDSKRRMISSFFAWMEDEEYIIKNPMRRIHKIKTDKIIKETYTDENMEVLRDNASNIRDLAIIDLLYSTGMRVGELVKLNINDIDFENRECIVFGKGNKQRKAYFDAKAKIHLEEYLNSRNDDNEALFVTLDVPHSRMHICGVELRLRKLGKKAGLNKVHPHKFRRTLATKAIDKGMPIEQVQRLLGHSQIDTTMRYATINQNNVKISHSKYIA